MPSSHCGNEQPQIFYLNKIDDDELKTFRNDGKRVQEVEFSDYVTRLAN